MRGKAFHQYGLKKIYRITPAYAGKRWFRSPSSFALGDHPRLCGEKLLCRKSIEKIKGSPPPMRGKAGRLLQSKGHHRITPAYAGKRQLGTRQKSENKDHPRLCGEKCSRRASSSPIAGSPPPMRGKVPFCCSIGIPSEDHPRLCGEKQHCTNSPAEQRGSPPPMRGKDLSIYVAGIERRITPAYAGKSSINVPPPLFTWDHPRLCGEKLKA